MFFSNLSLALDCIKVFISCVPMETQAHLMCLWVCVQRGKGRQDFKNYIERIEFKWIFMNSSLSQREG